MKKRFPRFSLRALVIAVLGIAMCWTLTATWGVSTVLNYYSKALAFPERSGNILRAAKTNAYEDVNPDKVWEYRATAIAPFVIRLTFFEGGVLRAEPVTHLWFFGYRYQWTPAYEGYRKK